MNKMGMANAVAEAGGLLADDSAEMERCGLGVLRRQPNDPRAGPMERAADAQVAAVVNYIRSHFDNATRTRLIPRRAKPCAPSATSAREINSAD